MYSAIQKRTLEFNRRRRNSTDSSIPPTPPYADLNPVLPVHLIAGDAPSQHILYPSNLLFLLCLSPVFHFPTIPPRHHQTIPLLKMQAITSLALAVFLRLAAAQTDSFPYNLPLCAVRIPPPLLSSRPWPASGHPPVTNSQRHYSTPMTIYGTPA